MSSNGMASSSAMSRDGDAGRCIRMTTATEHWTATHGFMLFETAIGRCGVAWGERGITGVQLPEASDGRTIDRLLRRVPGAARQAPPPPSVERATEGIVDLLRGGRVDLSAIVLDMDRVPAFDGRVYEVARRVPAGSTLSYGEVAARAGAPAEARAVGQALGRNPFAIVVPCHRVVAADGRLGGFSAHGGTSTKQRLLSIEGVPSHTALALF
jgi:methylated-DNA-[protein]-cysteine S-methyltransferase